MFVGLSVCFLSATRHLSTLRRCLPVLRESSQAVAGGPAHAAGKRMHSAESTRTHAVQLFNEKIATLMPFKNKTVRARACCRIRNCRDFPKKGKRKPTCHFPSSVCSLPSLGVFTSGISAAIFSLRSCTACAFSLCMLARAARRAARDGSCSPALGGSAAKWTNVVWPIKSRQTNTHYSFIGID